MANTRQDAASIVSRAGLRAPSAELPSAPTAAPTAPASRIDANVPAGVHSGTFGQDMVPFLGTNLIPTGQAITVNMNAPSPHLPFREWMLRGIVGGAGHVAAYPFRLVGSAVHGLAMGLVDVVVTILKWVLIVIIIPAMLIMGLRIANHVYNAQTIEAGTTGFMHDGRHAIDGVGKGATSDLPAETPENMPGSKGARAKD